jgi:hypothetical protein
MRHAAMRQRDAPAAPRKYVAAVMAWRRPTVRRQRRRADCATYTAVDGTIYTIYV